MFAYRSALLVACLLLTSCHRSQPPFDLAAVARRSPAEVAEILGEPTGTRSHPEADGRTIYDYEGGNISIVYDQGQAESITVALYREYEAEQIPLSPGEALAALALPPAIPTDTLGTGGFVWTDVAGYEQVVIVGNPHTRIAHRAMINVRSPR